LQCDFESPFWEESDCNWSYGMGSLKMSRELVSSSATSSDYWKAMDGNSGQYKRPEPKS